MKKDRINYIILVMFGLIIGIVLCAIIVGAIIR